jgi:hypothetical protein
MQNVCIQASHGKTEFSKENQNHCLLDYLLFAFVYQPMIVRNHPLPVTFFAHSGVWPGKKSTN